MVDGLAFGQGDFADLDGQAQFGDVHLDRDRADAEFADEGMRPAIAALGGVGHAEDEAFVSAGQRLESERAGCGEFHRFTGEVRGGGVGGRLPLDQVLAVEEIHDMGDGVGRRGGLSRLWRRAFGGEGEVEQAVGIVEGGAENLAAGESLKVAEMRRSQRMAAVSSGREAPNRGSVVR